MSTKTITIDGKSIPFRDGDTIMDATLRAGEYIPHLCHNPEFKPHGSCRLCVVDVNGRHQSACTLPAEAGMDVMIGYTAGEEAAAEIDGMAIAESSGRVLYRLAEPGEIVGIGGRVLTLLDPGRDPLGSGYHIIQSQIAIGSGGVYGRGWLNGSQSHLDFLPERSTDFIFAVFSEEFGFLGNLLLLSGGILVLALLTLPAAVAGHYVHSLGRMMVIATLLGAGLPLDRSLQVIRELGEAMTGPVILSEHPEYESSRKLWNGMHDKHPALIARCLSTEDVTNAIDFARDHGLLTAIRGGGHSVPGFGTIDDGVVVDLSGMRTVTVDPVNGENGGEIDGGRQGGGTRGDQRRVLSGAVTDHHIGADAQLADQRLIAACVARLQIVEQAATLRHELEQAPARVIVLLVCFEVLGEVRDSLGEDRHLHFGRPRVALPSCELLDEFGLAFRRDRHRSGLR